MAVNPSLFAHLPYDPIRDFAPVGMLAEFPFVVLVSKNFPAHSIEELIALAKARPGEINYASAGNGTGQHLSMELFKLMTGINLTHVPYRGAAPADSDVISGQVPVFIDNLASGLGQIKGAKTRALAVTGKERSPLLPDVPTVEEAGVPGYVYDTWFGLWAPKETPQPILGKLHAALKNALADPTLQARIAAGAGQPLDMPLADIEPFLKSEIAKWADVVKRAGVTAERVRAIALPRRVDKRVTRRLAPFPIARWRLSCRSPSVPRGVSTCQKVQPLQASRPWASAPMPWIEPTASPSDSAPSARTDARCRPLASTS